MKKLICISIQISQALKEDESGKAPDICRELKISWNMFYVRKRKYEGMDFGMLHKYKGYGTGERPFEIALSDEL